GALPPFKGALPPFKGALPPNSSSSSSSNPTSCSSVDHHSHSVSFHSINNCCLSSSLNIPISEIGSDTVRIDSNSVWKFSNILSIVLPSNRSLLYCKIPPKFSSSFPSSTTVVVLLNMVNVKSN